MLKVLLRLLSNLGIQELLHSSGKIIQIIKLRTMSKIQDLKYPKEKILHD